MRKQIVNKKFLEGYVSNGYKGSEAVTLHNDQWFLKFIKPHYLKGDREKIIEGLHEFSYPDIIIPEFSLIEQSKFVGYGMEYAKDFESIGNIITNDFYNDEDFNKRKQAMIKLCKIFDYFDTQYFAYFDIHHGNILFKDGDIKLIDLDGGVLRPYSSDRMDYNVAIRASKKSLALYTLSFLYNMESILFHVMIDGLDSNNKKELFNHLPKNIRDYYAHALNYKYGVFCGSTEAINDFTEDLYFETKDIIKKRLI